MAATIRSKGAFGSGTTSFLAAVPTGGSAPVSGDALYIIMESSDSTTAAGTPTTPGGWTKLFEETQGAGATGVTTLTVFGKIAGAGEADVTVNGVGNHCSGRMFVIMGHGLSVIGDTVVGAGNGADTGNGTVTGITVTAGSLVLICVATTRDANNTTTFSAWTNGNLTSILEEQDQTVSTGAGGGTGVASGQCAGTTTGNSTVTIAVSVQWRSVHLGIAPASVVDHALAFDMPLGLTIDTALQPTEHPLAFDFPLGLVIDSALQPTEHPLAFDMPLGLTVDTAITRETFAAFDMPLGLQIDTNLSTLVEHFLAFDMPLGLTIDTALTRETFVAFAMALGLQIDSALTREAFLAWAQDLGLQIDTSLLRETFASFDFPIALDISTNLTLPSTGEAHGASERPARHHHLRERREEELMLAVILSES